MLANRRFNPPPAPATRALLYPKRKPAPSRSSLRKTLARLPVSATNADDYLDHSQRLDWTEIDVAVVLGVDVAEVRSMRSRNDGPRFTGNRTSLSAITEYLVERA